jgi:predicted SnoaL-like aldol condensation-catalyzing enzyme
MEDKEGLDVIDQGMLDDYIEKNRTAKDINSEIVTIFGGIFMRKPSKTEHKILTLLMRGHRPKRHSTGIVRQLLDNTMAPYESQEDIQRA